jgi:hypothetical protein
MSSYSNVLMWILVSVFGIFVTLDWLGFFDIKNDDENEDKK